MSVRMSRWRGPGINDLRLRPIEPRPHVMESLDRWHRFPEDRAAGHDSNEAQHHHPGQAHYPGAVEATLPPRPGVGVMRRVADVGVKPAGLMSGISQLMHLQPAVGSQVLDLERVIELIELQRVDAGP